MEVNTDRLAKDMASALAEGYDELTYTYEPILGPYVTIDLHGEKPFTKNYDPVTHR